MQQKRKNARPSLPARTAILIASFACIAAAGLFYFLPRSGQGERIWREIPHDVAEYVLRDGVIYFTQAPVVTPGLNKVGNSDHPWAILEKSAFWGTQKTVYAQNYKPNIAVSGFQATEREFLWLETTLPEPLGRGASASPHGFGARMADGVGAMNGLYVRLPVKMHTGSEKGYLPNRQYVGGLKAPAEIRDMGAFPLSNAPLPPPLIVQQTDKTPYNVTAGGKPNVVTLCRLPRTGGAVTRQLLNPPVDQLAPGGKAFYYRLSAPWRTRYIGDGKTLSFSEYPPIDRLYRVPANGGTAQEIASGLIPSDLFAVTEQFACWTKRAPYPDGTVTLYLLPHTENAKPMVLPDYRSDTLPVEYKGRLYWIEFAPADAEKSDPQGRTGALERRLVSALPNSGDRQIVVTATDAHNVPRRLTRLLNANGKLYVTYEQREPNKQEPQQWVARLRPDRLPVLGTPCRLKGGTVVCDADYCYAEASEKERRWVENFDFLFAESVITDKYSTSLYRFRVPE